MAFALRFERTGAGGNWTFTPSAQWVNEFRFGWNASGKRSHGRLQQAAADYASHRSHRSCNFGMPTIIISDFNNPTLGGNRSWPLFTIPNETNNSLTIFLHNRKTHDTFGASIAAAARIICVTGQARAASVSRGRAFTAALRLKISGGLSLAR